MQKGQASFDNFDKLDIRVGKVLSAEKAKTNKPTYRMKIDFGPDIGVKQSCGAYTNYRPEDLIGRQIIGIINFGAKKMGPELSEVLVLGVHSPSGSGTIYLTTESEVPNGEIIF